MSSSTRSRAATGMRFFRVASLGLLAAVLPAGIAHAQALNASNPPVTQKLVFVHHSTGENWLGDDNGGLGLALRDANYFVSDTNYGWGPADLDAGGGTIGDHTDVGNFYSWFAGPHSGTHLAALFVESGQNSSYSRRATDPGGANAIVLLKSCFPNSNLQGALTDPVPPIDSNPLRHQDAYSEHHTFANAKGIYESLLTSFASRQDKLYILITSPPLVTDSTSPEAALLARALNDWLVSDWLESYPHRNVFVFDFFDVLTSNGGASRTDDPDTNDLGWSDGNHHRLRNGVVEHMRTVANDFSAYGSSPDDSHPTPAGNLKATGEFVALLNVAFHCWKETGGCPPVGPPGASAFHTLVPCRVVNTRRSDYPEGLGAPSIEPAGSPDRSFPLTSGSCGIPATAKSVALNITVAETAGAGYLTLYPGDGAAPLTSTINFGAGQVKANNAILPLAGDGSGTIKVKSGSTGTLNLLVDVVGYFE